MAKDRVHPLKLEDAETGGTETDFAPTELDKNEDFVDAHGITIQNIISDDSDVYLTRDAEDSMVFADKVVGRPYTLQELTSGGFAIGIMLITTEGGFVYDSTGKFVVKASA
jgi:hypothetical protein